MLKLGDHTELTIDQRPIMGERSPEEDKLDQVAVADCNNFFGHHR